MQSPLFRPQTLRSTNGSQPVPLPSPPALAATPGGTNEAELRQVFTMLRRRAPLIAGVALLVMGAVGVVIARQVPVYESNFQILVESVTGDNKLSDLARTVSPDQQSGGQSSVLDYPTQIQVLLSPELLNSIVKQVQQTYPDFSYNELIGGLSVIRLGETKILQVSYRNDDPKRVETVLQKLADGYLNYSLKERQTNLRQGLQFVEKQLPKLQEKVDQLQEQIQVFRQQYDFIDPQTQAGQIAAMESNLAQQRLQTDQTIAALQQQFSSLQSGPGGLAALKDAGQYQSLIGQLRQTEIKLIQESTRFQDANPTIQALQEQRDKLIPLLRDEAGRVLGTELAVAAVQLEEAQVRSQAIAQAQAQTEQDLQQLPVLSRQYVDFQRELQVATDSLNRFLSTRETLQIQAAQTDIPWQIIKAPKRPTSPASPDVQRLLLIGLAASLITGIAAALLAERLDNVFHSADDLTEKTRLPLLGSIPYDRELKRKLLPEQSNTDAAIVPAAAPIASGFSDAFYALHNNIRLLSSDKLIRSIIISSALPGDGKSTIAMNLAQAAVAMGQRVLIVDADLRCPQVHTLMGMPNLQGLSDAITARLPMQQVIQQSPHADNLYVLTAGQQSPDPTKLLSSNRMQRLMESAPKVFDLVIYDMPPILGLADVGVVAEHADGIILVANMGKTDRTSVVRAIESLNMLHTPILGTVANGVRERKSAAYGKYYRTPTRSIASGSTP